MRSCLGFYPTGGKKSATGDEEWSLYVACSDRLTTALKEKRVNSAHARSHFSDISSIVAEEVQNLQTSTIPNFLTTPEECQAYAYAVLYSVMGSFNQFCESRSHSKEDESRKRSRL